MPSTLIMTVLIDIGISAATVSLLAPAIIFGSRLITAYVISNLFLKRTNSNEQTNSGSRVQLPPATNNKLPIFYGTAWLKPTITDAKISTDQKTMWYVLAFSEVPNLTSGLGGGTISFGTIRWGDKTLNFDGTDQTRVVSWTNGANETDTRVDGKINVYRYTDGSNSPQSGTPTSAITVLQDSAIASGQRWASTDLMSKIAFLIIKVQYDQEIGLVSLDQITAQCINTINNPGDAIYDYLTNDRYGCDIPSTQINTTSLTDLNTYSAQTITYTPSGGGSATQARYKINGPVDTGRDCMTNLQTICDACDSWLQWNEATAQWGIVINKGYDQSPNSVILGNLYNLSDDNVIGAINLNPVDLNSTYNRIEVEYPDTNIYDQAGYAYVDLDAADRNPNEPDNVLNMSLPLVNNNVQAKYIATRRLIQSREDLVVNCTVDYSGIQIDAGDVVRFNSTKFQWVDKLFRVTQVQEGKDQQGFLYAQLSLIEYNPQVYENIDITQFIPSPNTGITDPNIAATPNAPVVANIVNNVDIPRFDINVTIPAQGRYGQLQLWYSNTTDSLTQYTLLKTLLPSDSNTFASGAVISYTVTGIPAGTYYFRAVVVTVTGSQSSYSPASTALIWSPTINVPGATSVNLEWNPTAIFCSASSDGGNVVTGQTAALYLRSGPNVVNIWNKVTPATQPNNTWYANTITSTAGLSTSALTLDTGLNAATFTVTGLTADQGTATVSNIFYKDNSGNVNTIGSSEFNVTKIKNGANGSNGGNGGNGSQYSSVYLYQWNITTPGNPSGNSTFTWSNGQNSTYTGGNGWQVTVPANPNTPLVQLWVAAKQINAVAGTLTSTVDWTSGFSVYAASQNGNNGANGANGSNGTDGTKTAVASVFRWALSTPTISGPNGTYTWSDGSISGIPSGWGPSPGNPPSTGYTLYEARSYLQDAASALTTAVVWASTNIIAAGYSGATGGTAISCYSRIPGNPSPGTAIITVAGKNPPTQAQSAATAPTGWGLNYAWSLNDPNTSSTDSLFQSFGVYDPIANTTAWDTPFLSSLRVGQLSAITVNTGNLTVSGQIQAGNIARTGTTVSTGTRGSIFVNDGTFALGNDTTNITFDGTRVTLNGPLATVASGQATTGSTDTFGNASAWTGNVVNVVNITTTGAPVKVIGSVAIQYDIKNVSSSSFAASAQFQVRLKMDGNYLANGVFNAHYSTFASPYSANARAVIPRIPIVYRHTPSAGAHTYQIELYVGHFDDTGAIFTSNGTMYGQYYVVAEENKI